MAQGIIIDTPGGVENMKYGNIPDHKLEYGELRIKNTAIGVNYIDVYYRKGLYKCAFPNVLGIEAVGVVEEAAIDVAADFKPGDRVAYGTNPTLLGAYSTHRNMPFEYVTKIPDYISDEVAATLMVKGMTAHMLCQRAIRMHQGWRVLVHAAAGGVGTYLCQWLKYLGAIVIGTVGSDDKIKWAEENGCTYVINYNKEDFVQKVRDYTEGAGVSVCYDSVGKDTFQKSMNCIMPFGVMISYGQSSGFVPPIEILELARTGVFLTRPTLNLYKKDYNEFIMSSVEIFEGVKNNFLRPHITHKIPLKDAAEAHKLLESRETKGSIILIP